MNLTRSDIEKAIAIASEMIKKFEGTVLKPYLCSAGVATIGIGSTRYENGAKVTLLDKTISLKKAEDMMTYEVKNVCVPVVLRLCPGVDNPYRLAALIDFAFNLGAGNLKASTLRRKVNAGQWEDVPAELRKWVKGGGRVLPGLVKRREAEASLI